MSSSVATIHTRVNAELSHALVWLERMAERGMYGTNAARLKATGIRQLMEALGDDEPRTVEWFLENVDSIGTRWANITTANPGTMRAYVSRARGALSAYLQYLEDPASFKPRTRGSAKPSGRNDEAPKKAKAKTVAGKQDVDAKQEDLFSEPPAEPSKSAELSKSAEQRSGGTMRDFVLDRAEGRRFLYELPDEGIRLKDASKIALHLITMCDDFDPMAFVQLLAVLKRMGEDAEPEESAEIIRR